MPWNQGLFLMQNTTANLFGVIGPSDVRAIQELNTDEQRNLAMMLLAIAETPTSPASFDVTERAIFRAAFMMMTTEQHIRSFGTLTLIRLASAILAVAADAIEVKQNA
jgi:hypothetical protein